MLVEFFLRLKSAGMPVALTEFLTLLGALKARVAEPDVDEFYYLARICLVKDERHFDRFDRVFAAHFRGVEQAFSVLVKELPSEWLRALADRLFTAEEKARIRALGGWDKLMETLLQRLAEQRERHQGGDRWIGTGGTSPFGAQGFNPEGIRIGQASSRQRRAVKVWDRREYRNLDDMQELGTRNIKIALRRLRRFAREGAPVELDLGGTIDATARNAGLLDLKMIPERHNAVKVLLFLDAGGSMDDHVRVCEELFSAARSEFKHLEHYYFHNCVYEYVWKDNRRRFSQHTPTLEVMRTYGADYRLILVGDATMGPYELSQPGGSVEHWNDEPGAVWIERLCATFPHHVWLNPEPAERWQSTPSIRMLRALVGGRMFPLTLGGLEAATRELRHAAARLSALPAEP